MCKNMVTEVIVTKWEKWERWRVGSEVEVISLVSSGIDRRCSYRLLPFRNKICVHVWGSSNCRVTRQHSEHNQWHVGSHFSRVEFQTFKLWSGQTKHVTMFTQDTRGPNKNQCFQKRLAELTHADIHTYTNKSLHTQTRAYAQAHARRTQQQFCARMLL